MEGVATVAEDDDGGIFGGGVQLGAADGAFNGFDAETTAGEATFAGEDRVEVLAQDAGGGFEEDRFVGRVGEHADKDVLDVAKVAGFGAGG